ncbi:MAG: GH3 auxin-responsive promoter family protein [Thermodesulfovibrionales bacterium]
MGFFLSSIIRAGGALDRIALARDTRHPDQAQKEFLLRLIKKNKNTRYGEKYAFSSIDSEKDFRNNLPVVEYSDIEPYIEQIKTGSRNVLTSEPVSLFNMTSGTTARPKYIPLTRQGKKRAGRLMRQWFSHALSDHPSLLDKGFLSITGAAVEGRCESGIPYGSASGMINNSLPALVRSSMAVPAIVAEIADYDIRYYVWARLAYGKPISFIATPNPLTLVKLAETALGLQEEIIRSIHNGWVSDSLQNKQSCIDAGISGILLSKIRPDRTRAAFLEGVLEKTGRLLPADIWPDLALIGCWLGGSIGFHTESLSKYYGGVALRDVGYMASEGCITLPLEDATPAGVLTLQNNYYEFVPETQLDHTDPDILVASELEAGKCYKVILTNENGLYRYDINDIVRVDGFYHQTPVISFLRKSGNILNITGEKLHLNHCLSAIDRLQSCFSLDIRQFRIVPDLTNLRYEFFLDIRSEVPGESRCKAMLTALDAALCENNIEYDSRRRSKRLNSPCIHVMDSSWEDEVRKEHAQFGQRDVQYKWIQLSAEKNKIDFRHIKYTIQ